MMRQILAAGGALALLATTPAVSAHEMKAAGEAPHVLELADVLDWETVSNPQISPDGVDVLYTRTRVDTLKDRRVSTTWIMKADGSDKRQLLEGSGAQWSPDGKRILFSKADADGRTQLFLHSPDGLITQLTHMEHAPRSMAFSPDGKTIAFVARVPKKNDWTIELPPRPKGAEWSEDPVIIDTLHYRQDRVGITNDGFDHIFTVPATGGTPKQLTDGDWNVGARALAVIAGAPKLAWSADSRFIAFDGPGEPVADESQWWRSDIHLLNVETRETKRLTSGRGSWRDPVFARDGEALAFIGYEDHDKLTPLADVWLMAMDDAEPRALTSGLDDSPQGLRFTPDGRELLFTMASRGHHNLHAVNRAGRLRDITTGRHVVRLGSVSDAGRIAITMSDPDSPGAVAVLPSPRGRARIAPLTAVNDDVLDGVTLGRVEEIAFEATAANGERADVQGWIIYPAGYQQGESYPTVLSIHGGPQAMYTSAFNLYLQQFAAAGYAVVYVNPRGSTGFGEEFTNVINAEYPGQFDYADLMAGVDLAIEKGVADPDRLFVTGCSGGGVLTTHVIAQTNRFKAAAALCPVTNWISMTGGSDVSAWVYSYFDTPFWKDPSRWLENSTLMHVGKVETPTLLMTGTQDIRTPLNEAEQYYTALTMRGVPTKLIPMPNEWHGTSSRPSNYLRTHLYLRKWFEEHDPALAEAEDD